jgi:hypothetical protein
MTVQSLTIDQIVVSDYNVRLNQEDANATTAIENSIAASGLWLPLVVHPITVLPSLKQAGATDVTKQLWGVLDGGRRCRAIRNLVDAGRLPPDWPIDCVVRDVDPAKITELSLGAALLARELRSYEVDAAVARMQREGMAVEEIARNLGQPEEWVLQRLRLGNLAPAIFDAYAAGHVSLDQAQAYGSVAEHDLQMAAFAHFSGLQDWDRRPANIRAFLRVGDRELEKLLRFVGADVYRAAGGAYHLDLFADLADQRGRVADEVLLRKLVDSALDVARKDLRRRTARPKLQFTLEPPKLHGYPDSALQVYPDDTGETIDLPGKAIVGRLEILDDGGLRTNWWWESRKAKAEEEKAARRSATDGTRATAQVTVRADAGFTPGINYQAAQEARALVKEQHGLTADGLQVIRTMRRELLRALLVSDAEGAGLTVGDLGRDYVIWAQLRHLLTDHARGHEAGARGLASERHSEDSEPGDIVGPHLEQSEAHATWQRAVTQIRAQPFIELRDHADALQAFVDADERTKLLAGAVLAGIALLRSANADGWRLPVHDRLAALAGGDDPEMLRAFWWPTPAFVGLFPKLRRLELAQPFEQTARIKALAGGKDAEVTRAATEILAAQCWVHPLLAFGPVPIAEAAR